MKNVDHSSALSSYQLISSNNTVDYVRGKLHRIACQLERKEKGARFVWIDAVTNPGATVSMLSLDNAEKMQCNVRPAPGVRITMANGAALDMRGQTDMWIQTHVGKKLTHMFVMADLAQDLLISADDCELMELLQKNWPNEGLGGKASPYSKKYEANTVKQEEEKRKQEKGDTLSEAEEQENSQVDLTELA